ncbi:uncharacterized protein [Parasteatoda tepidariorum]|uniref:uncharacterized protein n=1 Tax=Parasteatoda tepidariorum TaxID=114398 RepID=UPI00077FDCAD|nr:uncharacterized protein LOC107436275 [Parasteatoda tepidariorum]
MAQDAEKNHSLHSEQSLEEVEWNRLKEYRLKEGFIDGKCLGEETTLKNGYDQGYKKGFEISFPISVIKGLLTVNKLLLKDCKTHLLAKANVIDEVLDKFERKCSEFKLSEITYVKGNDISTDLQNENVKTLLKDLVCEDSHETLAVDGNHLNEINVEFAALKETILIFLDECQQPLLLSQIFQVFEKWEYKQLIQLEEIVPKSCEESVSLKESTNI